MTIIRLYVYKVFAGNLLIDLYYELQRPGSTYQACTLPGFLNVEASPTWRGFVALAAGGIELS